MRELKPRDPNEDVWLPDENLAHLLAALERGQGTYTEAEAVSAIKAARRAQSDIMIFAIAMLGHLKISVRECDGEIEFCAWKENPESPPLEMSHLPQKVDEPALLRALAAGMPEGFTPAMARLVVAKAEEVVSRGLLFWEATCGRPLHVRVINGRVEVHRMPDGRADEHLSRQ